MEPHANYFDVEGHLLPFGEATMRPVATANIKILATLKEMGKYAEMIAAGHKFLRVDFYSNNNIDYFGELTFFPASGLGKYTDDQWDLKIDEMLNLTAS